MADFGRGIKAGAAVAGIYLVISVILGAISWDNPLSIPYFIYAAGLTPVSSLALSSPLFVISLLFRHVVRGIVFGAVFAALYRFLPGTKSLGKGVLLSLFLCIVAVVETIYMTPGLPTEGVSFAGSYYSGQILLSSSPSMVWPGIISALIFGALTGFLWDRFRAKELTEERNGRSLLLVGLILGLATWIVIAVPFLLAVVVNKGIPAVQSEFWWSETLLMSVVFLGLPGWLLTCVGWKRTKVDESGLKWGVAGGLLMSLTGILLLPGALAIAGGVLSGRKPATEPSTVAIEQ